MLNPIVEGKHQWRWSTIHIPVQLPETSSNGKIKCRWKILQDFQKLLIRSRKKIRFTNSTPQCNAFSKTTAQLLWMPCRLTLSIFLKFSRPPVEYLLDGWASRLCPLCLRPFGIPTLWGWLRFDCAPQTVSQPKPNGAIYEALGTTETDIADWLCTFSTQVLRRLLKSVDLVQQHARIQIPPLLCTAY